jgi:hypothetical protein
MTVQIIGVTLNPDPHPIGHKGGRILAFFDCKIAGIGLFGCAYMENYNGSFIALPPKIWHAKDKRRRVLFLDPDLRKQIRDAAAEAYRSLA